MSNMLQEMSWYQLPADAAQVTPRVDQVLFDRMWSFVPKLRGYLRHRLSPVEAGDVIQEVFLRLFQCASCRTVTFPKSYLFETAHAVLIDRRRRAASRCASMHCELTDSHDPTNELSPLRILLGREQLKAVESAIECLPTRTREIIIAIRIEGASLNSLAARYRISTSAVETRRSRPASAVGCILGRCEHISLANSTRASGNSSTNVLLGNVLMSHSNRYSESTRLVHEARQPDLPRTLAPPVQRSSTVLLPSASALYDASHVNYGRGGLATHQALRDALAELEAAERVFLFPSGLAAITGSLQALTSSGDEVLICGSQEVARLSKPYRESKFVQLRASCRVKDQ